MSARGAVLPFVGGPWDGQEVFVPTTPRPPDTITFPVQWHDGSWDNAHWHWRYVHRNTSGRGPHYECGSRPVAVPGLTAKERAEQEARMPELLVFGPSPDTEEGKP